MVGSQDAGGRPDSGQGKGRNLKRRGLIAGAAALAAGVLAREAAPVAAVNPPFLLGQDNIPPTTNVATSITAYAGFGGGTTTLLFANASPSGNAINGVGGTGSASGSGVLGTAGTSSGIGVTGTGGSVGVRGSVTTGTAGVVGTYNVSTPPVVSGNGVAGYASAGNVGVYGQSTGGIDSNGVYGKTDIGVGVVGFATGAGKGVSGGSVGGNGVYGVALAAGTTQVVAGVFGDSDSTYGLIGRTTAAGYSGLTAITSTAGVAALAATSTVSTAYAAYFTGKTVVQGDFFVVGGAKSAAVPHADGTHRAVYCVESPESWFEDFGKAKLTGGKAEVKLDPDFASIVHTDDYHVFLTPGGDFQMHLVQQTTGTGSAGASGAFSYRVVAKRKDIAAKRLAKVDLPKINIPDPTKLPKH